MAYNLYPEKTLNRSSKLSDLKSSIYLYGLTCSEEKLSSCRYSIMFSCLVAFNISGVLFIRLKGLSVGVSCNVCSACVYECILCVTMTNVTILLGFVCFLVRTDGRLSW